MIRRVVFALIVGGVLAPWASAQTTPASKSPASPSAPDSATPQTPPKAELAELALLFHDLGQLGADERRVAAQIAEDFLAYARKRRR